MVFPLEQLCTHVAQDEAAQPSAHLSAVLQGGLSFPDLLTEHPD